MKILHYLSTLFLLSTTAKARDWGFDKDTVYETNGPSGFYDSISIVNNSADTLRFDTATIEIVYSQLQKNHIDLSITGRPFGPVIDFSGPANGRSSSVISQLIVAPNSKKLFSGITMSASPSGPDSLIARLVFYSGSSTDTAFVKGDAASCCVAIIPSLKSGVTTIQYTSQARDIKGRKANIQKTIVVLKKR